MHTAMQMWNGTWQRARPRPEQPVIAGLCSSPAKPPLWSSLCAVTGTFLANRRKQAESELMKESCCKCVECQSNGRAGCHRAESSEYHHAQSIPPSEESCPISSCRQWLKADICPSNSTEILHEGNTVKAWCSPLDLIWENPLLLWNRLGSGPKLSG